MRLFLSKRSIDFRSPAGPYRLCWGNMQRTFPCLFVALVERLHFMPLVEAMVAGQRPTSIVGMFSSAYPGHFSLAFVHIGRTLFWSLSSHHPGFFKHLRIELRLGLFLYKLTSTFYFISHSFVDDSFTKSVLLRIGVTLGHFPHSTSQIIVFEGGSYLVDNSGCFY